MTLLTELHNRCLCPNAFIMQQNTTNTHCWKFEPQSSDKQRTFTGISSSWFAVSAVKTYDISLWDVVCLQMAHLIELRRVPTLYCSMMIATHSLQKQCPHVSTAHYAGNKKNQHKHNCGSDLDHWKRKLVY